MQVAEDAGYASIFNHRGGAYAQAMRDFPRAREAEFRSIFRRFHGGPSVKIADVPAGGGYLRPYVPASAILDAYDPSLPFQTHGLGVSPVDLQRPRLRRPDYDLIVSLASVHHLIDKARFFGGLVEHCSEGGQIVVADVAADSKVAHFLDGFIGQHNGTGHDGWFLNPADPFDFGRDERRLGHVDVERLTVPWKFASEADMAQFCLLLFGTRDLRPSKMIDALRDCVGVAEDGDGVSLQWELTYIFVRLC